MTDAVFIKFGGDIVENTIKDSDGYVAVALVTANLSSNKMIWSIEQWVALLTFALQGMALNTAVSDLGKKMFTKKDSAFP